MNFSQSLEKIESSASFKNFKKQHPDAELCAGFFVLDYQGSNQQQLDYILKNKKIFTFIIDENQEVTIKEAETIEGKKQALPPLDKEVKVDLDDIEKIVQEKIKQEKLKEVSKIIAVLQKHEGRQIWNLNCMLSNMEILRIHIDTSSGGILKFEKKSMMDFVKKVK